MHHRLDQGCWSNLLLPDPCVCRVSPPNHPAMTPNRMHAQTISIPLLVSGRQALAGDTDDLLAEDDSTAVAGVDLQL